MLARELCVLAVWFEQKEHRFVNKSVLLYVRTTKQLRKKACTISYVRSRYVDAQMNVFAVRTAGNPNLPRTGTSKQKGYRSSRKIEL